MAQHVHLQKKSKEAKSWGKKGGKKEIKWQGSTVDHCDNCGYYSLLLLILTETHRLLFP